MYLLSIFLWIIKFETINFVVFCENGFEVESGFLFGRFISQANLKLFVASCSGAVQQKLLGTDGLWTIISLCNLVTYPAMLEIRLKCCFSDHKLDPSTSFQLMVVQRLSVLHANDVTILYKTERNFATKIRFNQYDMHFAKQFSVKNLC